MTRLIGLVLILAATSAPAAAARSGEQNGNVHGATAGATQGGLDEASPAASQLTGQTAGRSAFPFSGLDFALAGGAGVLLLGVARGLLGRRSRARGLPPPNTAPMRVSTRRR